MKDVYELKVFRRKVDVLMGVLRLTDEDGNTNDRWVFEGNGAIELNIVHTGTWFRTSSLSRITLVGDDNRIAGDFQYHAWPLASGRIGFLRTLREIRRGDANGDFYYTVESVV